MITLKNTGRSSPSPNILILQILPSALATPKSNKFKSHKLKRLQSVDASKHAKAAHLLEKINFNDLLDDQFPTQQHNTITPTTSSHHRSSYLAYKEEQRMNRAKHGKMTFLKSNQTQHSVSLDSKIKVKTVSRPVNTFDVPRSRRKMSMVVLGETLSEGNDDPSVLSHSRNIYMKTSEGKRQKIDPTTYMTRIKQKIQSLYECENSTNIITNNYLQHDYHDVPITISPVSNDRHVLARKIRSRNFKKESPLLRVQENGEQCRPWTSRKSDPPEQ